MGFSPRNQHKGNQARVSLTEDLDRLGMTEDQMFGGESEVFDPPAVVQEARRTREERERKNRLESLRRRKNALREQAMKEGRGKKWLKMYGEAKEGKFQPSMPRTVTVKSLVEDITELVAASTGGARAAKRLEHKRAFGNIAEVSGLLAKKYEARGDPKAKNIATMLRAMRNEALHHQKRLGEEADEPESIGQQGKMNRVSKNANPNPDDISTPDEVDLTDVSGDLDSGVPGEPNDMGSEPQEIDQDPEEMAFEDFDPQNPSGDIGTGKKPGDPTPTGEEPDLIDNDPHEMTGYVGEGENNDDDDDEDPERQDESEEEEEDPEAQEENYEERDDLDPDLEDEGQPPLSGLTNQDDEDIDPVPAPTALPPDTSREGQIKEMMRTLTQALSDYENGDDMPVPPAQETRRTRQ